MAVLSQYENKGISSHLVKAGLKRCRSPGYDAVVAPGHPHYYPRFGFTPSVQYGINSEYDVPDDVFMVLELTPGILKNHEGIIKYHDLFKSV